MKASELRIGNWLQAGSWIGAIRQVGAIGQHYIAFSHPNGGLDQIEAESVDPIPLTEEWLLRFGFKKDKIHWNDGSISDDCWVSANWQFLVHFSEDGIGFFQLIRLERSVLLTMIESVYQLQNLYFALTGEELKLSKRDQGIDERTYRKINPGLPPDYHFD